MAHPSFESLDVNNITLAGDPANHSTLTAGPRNNISATRFARIRRVFDSVAELNTEQRSDALRDLRRRDPVLALDVESLLSAYGKRDGFIEQPLGNVDSILPGNSSAALAGSIVGAYRMLYPIGQGGMGEVWCAEQQSPIRRRVAVKLIKAGMDTGEVVARFASERQALALMEHPAIARVFDAGSTPQGRPYFAMEYVAGIPITSYCDQHHLTLRDRLRLFISVCEGVQHAHQKAVIHRDLKPSNILVVEVDGKPAPKIIDFGVARATSRGMGADTAITQIGAILGTPEYMSPEQANSDGEDIDTRTDVYALGVILYELMAGALPFDLRRLALNQALRLLRVADAPRPSSRFRELSQAATIAANRKTQPDKLLRHLRGDLDAIILNAIEKDRSRRYDSPVDLAADIRRHLRNEPVLARPASLGYRAKKYLRRHIVVVSAAFLAALLILSFGIVEAVQLRRITREHDRADRIASFMMGMFRVSDPGESRGNQVTAREILDKASADVKYGLAGDPQVQAQMMEVMGIVYSNLGLYSQAETLLDNTVRIRRRIYGSRNPMTAHAMSALATTLHTEGKIKEGEKLDKESFDVLIAKLGADHPDTLRAMNNLARNLFDAGEYGPSEQLHRTVLETRRRVLGPEHPDTLTSLDNLAKTLDEEGRYAEAEVLEREALETRRRTVGSDHPATLRVLHHLADTLYGRGHYAEAAKLHREEMNDYLRVLGPEHRETLNAMIALANALDDQGKFSEAESIERRAIEVQLRVLGHDHPDTLLALNNLAEILGDEGRYREAEKVHRDVVDSRERVLGPSHNYTLYSISKLAWVLLLQGRLDEAEQLSQKARGGQIRVLGPKHPDTAETTYNLACIAARRGRTGEALSILRAAVEDGLKPRSILRIETDSNLASLRGNHEYASILAMARHQSAH